MKLAFVLAPRQNQFFVEIVDAMRDELDQLGIASNVHRDGFPPECDDLVYVLVPPHEWFNLDGRRHRPTTSQLARTIFVCAEQPGTAFFMDDVALASMAGAVFDINAGSVRAFGLQGVAGVRHLPLGWTRTWAHAPLDDEGLPARDALRDIDVLHLGIFSYHRAQALSAGGRWLSPWTCRLILGDDDRPNPDPAANFAVREAKWNLLTRSRVLLNVHVADRPYFEWLRIVQAISCGCAVVSEHSLGAEPLQRGRHFETGRAEVLGLLTNELLRDEDRRAGMGRWAYAALRELLPFRRSVEALVEAAEDITTRRRGAPAPIEKPLPELLVTPFEAEAPAAEQRYPEVTSDPDSADLRAALKESRLDFVELRRDLERWRRESREGPLAVVAIDRTSRAYAAAKPRVSVVTPLYNYGRHIETALASVVRGDYADIELVVVEDGSTDDSLAAARRFIAEHEGVPMVLVRHPINRGLGAARNTGVDFARGEFCFMLDADNELYRHALGRLVARLDEIPDAAASYGILERFSTGRPETLMSVYPWRADRFRTGNYIDAMALWRRRELQRLDAYTTDRRLYGWEDFDLWCRLAESGGRAELVQEILARYRVTRHSMLTLTNISARAAVSVLIERYPRVMAGVVPPAA